MSLVDRKSLAETIHRVNDAHLTGQWPPKAERIEAAEWIASRLGLPGGYRGMFAGTKRDLEGDVRLFTGERTAPWAGRKHVLAEEACRALAVLEVRTKRARDALAAAEARLLPSLRRAVEWQKEKDGRPTGEFCCGTCSLAMWRYMVVGGFAELRPKTWMTRGMKTLRGRRKGDGTWRRYPFYYALLTLSEIEAPGVVGEMRYA
ncbi:MAG: hypothetical protein ACYS99_15470, partial [Planctomycetota bacterium]